MRKNFAWRALVAIPLFLLLGSSCSLVYDLSTDQCGSNADCVTRFGQGFSCDDGLCTSPTSSAGSSGKGGKGGTGGSSEETAGASGDAAGEGGMSGSAVTGGTSGDAGKGGTAPVAECESHKDCFALYDDSDVNPRACVDGACVPLITPQCPYVLPLSDNGNWNLLKSTDAIILGAFAPLAGDQLGTIGRNYDLAVSELSKTTRGVYAGSNQRRQVVTVVCDWFFKTQDELLVPAKHLMEELKVPGVVSALLLQDQAYVWENVAEANNVFMMTPVYSDQELIDVKDNGLIWHMLSGANKLSVTYQPLLDMTVEHLTKLGTLTEDLKVAHVKAEDEPFLVDTANYLEANLQFNGQSVAQNSNASLYRGITITSAYKAPADPQANAIEAILSFAPHVVLGTTVSELYQYIIPGVEKDWAARNPTQARPFYLVGALGYADAAMPQMINSDVSTGSEKRLYQRILGVNWPGAVDNSVYEAYQFRYKDVFGTRQDGYENFYDAMYYLLYGLAAARAPLDGKKIAAGLQRVTESGSKIPQVDVGPSDDMVTYIAGLSDSTTKIELIGAMGPPNWDQYGGRNDPGSVWCVNTVGTYHADRLRYDPGTLTSFAAGSDIDCFTFPAP